MVCAILKELLLLLKTCDIFLNSTALDDEGKVLFNLGLLRQLLEIVKSGGSTVKPYNERKNSPITGSGIRYTNFPALVAVNLEIVSRFSCSCLSVELS